MNIDEIERTAIQAAHANLPDPPVDLLDASLYMALYQLYATLYAGQLTREQARPIKLNMVMQYRSQKAKYDFGVKCRQSAVNLWGNTESAGSAYSRNRTLENADQLWAAVLNLPEGSKPKNEGRTEEPN